jgi:hypothetical protein
MTITESVETDYAGYRFRSRLEARWAVFLDAAGIRWEYEPEQYLVSYRHRVRKWIPDFELPALGQFVEVKGMMRPDAFARTMDIASGLAEDGYDLVLLGHVPGWFTTRWPAQLHRHAEANGRTELWAVPWRREPGCPLVRHRAVPAAEITADLLLAGLPQVCPEWAEEPLESARRYRFAD